VVYASASISSNKHMMQQRAI